MRSKQHHLLKQITTKALLNLSITYKSGDLEGFRDKISATLNHSDNEVFKGFLRLQSLRLLGEEDGSPLCIEGVLADDDGNEAIWTACYVNETGSHQGPFRLKGGLIISKINIKETVDLTF